MDSERTDHGMGVDGCPKAALGRCWSGKTSTRSSDVSVMCWCCLICGLVSGWREGGPARAVSPFRAAFAASLQLSHENL